MPGESGVTVVTRLACLFYFTCEAAGASSARHSLRPRFFQGETFTHTSGAIRAAGMRKCALTSLRGANGSREYAPDDRLRDEAIHSSFRGAMDCFASARNDGL